MAGDGIRGATARAATGSTGRGAGCAISMGMPLPAVLAFARFRDDSYLLARLRAKPKGISAADQVARHCVAIGFEAFRFGGAANRFRWQMPRVFV